MSAAKQVYRYTAKCSICGRQWRFDASEPVETTWCLQIGGGCGLNKEVEAVPWWHGKGE